MKRLFNFLFLMLIFCSYISRVNADEVRRFSLAGMTLGSSLKSVAENFSGDSSEKWFRDVCKKNNDFLVCDELSNDYRVPLNERPDNMTFIFKNEKLVHFEFLLERTLFSEYGEYVNAYISSTTSRLKQEPSHNVNKGYLNNRGKEGGEFEEEFKELKRQCIVASYNTAYPQSPLDPSWYWRRCGKFPDANVCEIRSLDTMCRNWLIYAPEVPLQPKESPDTPSFEKKLSEIMRKWQSIKKMKGARVECSNCDYEIHTYSWNSLDAGDTIKLNFYKKALTGQALRLTIKLTDNAALNELDPQSLIRELRTQQLEQLRKVTPSPTNPRP